MNALSIDVLTMDGNLLQASLFESWQTGGQPGVRAVVTVTDGTVSGAIRQLRRRCREIFGAKAMPTVIRKEMKTRRR